MSRARTVTHVTSSTAMSLPLTHLACVRAREQCCCRTWWKLCSSGVCRVPLSLTPPPPALYSLRASQSPSSNVLTRSHSRSLAVVRMPVGASRADCNRRSLTPTDAYRLSQTRTDANRLNPPSSHPAAGAASNLHHRHLLSRATVFAAAFSQRILPARSGICVF